MRAQRRGVTRRSLRKKGRRFGTRGSRAVTLSPASGFGGRRRRRRSFLPLLVVMALVAAAAGFYLTRDSDEATTRAAVTTPTAICDVDVTVLERLWNGYVPGRSGEVIMAERLPHQLGGTRHSTPHPYTQDIPIVLYGPGFVRGGQTPDRPVTLADLAPTYAELLQFDEFRARDGRVLDEALLPEDQRNGIPRLIVTLVWDGGGDNVLQQWPDSWPNLADLKERGTDYVNASVGSSPSITPAVHATMGTGVFPKRHGLPDMKLRSGGEIVPVLQGASPEQLWTRTLGDLWDAANGNRPLVGMMAKERWHLGMIGHGAYLPEGDHDIAVMDKLGSHGFATNEDYYSLPASMAGTPGLDEAIEEVDLRDGEADGRWLGNEIDPEEPEAGEAAIQRADVRYTPAWPIYHSKRLIQLIEAEGFGADEMPDLLYTNYKTIDLAGHAWNMAEPESRDAVEETDRQLDVLVDALDRIVGRDNYVLALTADHGMAPYPRVNQGWGIEVDDMSRDLQEALDKVDNKKPILQENRGYQLMLDEAEMRRNGITAADVAEWVRGYRIRDNVTTTNTILEHFEGKEDELLFLVAATPEQLEEGLRCARRRQAGTDAKGASTEGGVALKRRSRLPK